MVYDDIVVDKSLYASLRAPLRHLVRRAVEQKNEMTDAVIVARLPSREQG